MGVLQKKLTCLFASGIQFTFKQKSFLCRGSWCPVNSYSIFRHLQGYWRERLLSLNQWLELLTAESGDQESDKNRVAVSSLLKLGGCSGKSRVSVPWASLLNSSIVFRQGQLVGLVTVVLLRWLSSWWLVSAVSLCRIWPCVLLVQFNLLPESCIYVLLLLCCFHG